MDHLFDCLDVPARSFLCLCLVSFVFIFVFVFVSYGHWYIYLWWIEGPLRDLSFLPSLNLERERRCDASHIYVAQSLWCSKRPARQQPNPYCAVPECLEVMHMSQYFCPGQLITIGHLLSRRGEPISEAATSRSSPLLVTSNILLRIIYLIVNIIKLTQVQEWLNI